MIEDNLTRGLRSKDIAERRRAVALIEDRTVFDWVSDRSERDISIYIPVLADALSDEDNDVRDGAMSAIFAAQRDRQDVKAAIPTILSLLGTCSETKLTKRAIMFLRTEVENGLDISGHVSLFEGKMARFGQDDLTLGAADTLALYYLNKKDWRSLDVLLHHENVEVRQEVVGTLDHSYARDIPPSTMRILESFLNDAGNDLSLVTARTLAPLARSRTDIERINLVLLTYLSHEDPKHVTAALSGIARLVERTVTCGHGLPREDWASIEPVINAISALMQHADSERNDVIAKILIEYHSHVDEWNAVNKLLLDGRPEVRSVSLEFLCRCGFTRCKIDATPAIPAIIELLPGDKDTLRIISNLIRNKHLQLPVLQSGIKASKLNVDEAWPYLDIIQQNQTDWNPNDAEKHLKSLEKGEKLPYVQEIASSRQGEPRRWAIHQIGILHIYEHLPIKKAIPNLVKFLFDENPFVRAESANTLAFISPHYDTRPAIPGLVKLLGDPAGMIQQSAAMAFAALAEKGDDISSALNVLASTLLRSSHAEARAQAAITFYNLAKKGIDLVGYHETIIKGTKDPNKSTHDLCTWAITQYIMNDNNVKHLLDLFKAAGVDEASDVGIQIIKKASSFHK